MVVDSHLQVGGCWQQQDNSPALQHQPPSTTTYNILQQRKPKGVQVPIREGQSELAFVNAGNRQPQQITCYNCGETGHIANDCLRRSEQPSQQQEQGAQQQAQGTNLCMQISKEGHDANGGFSFSQSAAQPILATWILLDNQSMVDLFCNSRLLKNIQKLMTQINVHCNAGQCTTDMVGDFPGYGTVWYDPNSIVNILSLHRMAAKYHVIYDSQGSGSNSNNNDGSGLFVMTNPDGTVFEFKASSGGLYFLDTESASTVNTVANIKGNYTNEDYLKALLARQLQIKIGHPSTKQFIYTVTSNQLSFQHQLQTWVPEYTRSFH